MASMEGRTAAFIITGLVIGMLSGTLGIGGAVLLVPTLVLGFGFSQSQAQGTSIGALVPPIGVFAAMQYYRKGLLDVRVAGLIALGFVFGALGGATLVPYIPQAWLRRAFASVLVYVAAQLVFADPNRRVGAVLPGMVAVGALWVLYVVRRALGKRGLPPGPPRPPSAPNLPGGPGALPPPETDYHI
jgi:uncharacterized protein